MAKRGAGSGDGPLFQLPLHLPRGQGKVLELARLLTPWCGRLTVHVVPFTEIQEELRRSCPESLFTLLMRRFMMRIAQRVAQRVGGPRAGHRRVPGPGGQPDHGGHGGHRAGGLSLPIFRPVVGMDKEEIVRIARKIGTFETSILPYEDCCTVFTPRHPKTRPSLEEIQEAEAALDIDGLIETAMQGIERVVLHP